MSDNNEIDIDHTVKVMKQMAAYSQGPHRFGGPEPRRPQPSTTKSKAVKGDQIRVWDPHSRGFAWVYKI